MFRCKLFGLMFFLCVDIFGLFQRCSFCLPLAGDGDKHFDTNKCFVAEFVFSDITVRIFSCNLFTENIVVMS